MNSPRYLTRCLMVGLCLAAPVAAIAADGFTTKKVLAYYRDDDGGSSKAMHIRRSYFNQVATDTSGVDAHGVVSGSDFANDMALARADGMQTFATVSNFAGNDFSPAIAHSVVHSASYTNAFISGMTKKLAAGRYTGVNVDFESVLAVDRKAYTAFIRTVCNRMHAAGYQVVVSVPAALNGDPADGWTGAFDFKALGTAVDVLQLMTYDQNGSWGDPGPVAGLDWVEQALRYTLTVVNPAKISFGIPAYGYDWETSTPANSVQIAWADVPTLIAATRAKVVWDTPSSAPHFSYTANGHEHIVWFENAQSVALKSRLAVRYDLAGVSVYALGMENVAFWKAVHAGGL